MTVLLTGLLIAWAAIGGSGYRQSAAPASPPVPAAQATREIQCDQARAKAAADGWDMQSIHLGCEPGVTLPVRTRAASPRYTLAALRARIEGVVGLEAVVETDGRKRSAP